MRPRGYSETRLLSGWRRRAGIVATVHVHGSIIGTLSAITWAATSHGRWRLLAVRVSRRWLRSIATEYIVLIEKRHRLKVREVAEEEKNRATVCD